MLIKYFAILAFAVVLPTSAVCDSSHTAAINHIGSSWDAYGNFLDTFRITNKSETAIYYSGYGPDAPVFDTQILKHSGLQDMGSSGWCGVGLGSHSLAPHQSVNFSVPIAFEAPTTWRIGMKISLMQKTNVPPKSESVWSTIITTKSRKQIDQAGSSAKSFVRTTVTWHPEKRFPYTFVLANISTNTLFYGGFSETDVPPIYLDQEQESGLWKDNGSVNWCGTHLGFWPLQPGQSITFSIPAQGLDHTWRSGIRLYRSRTPITPEDAFLPVWWQELPPRGKTPKLK
jgi:hypothetical protein